MSTPEPPTPEQQAATAAAAAAAAAAAVAAAAAPAINSSVPFPEPLKLSGNIKENVDNFVEAFEIYLIASGLEARDERVKIASFKVALGTEARKIFNLWPLQPAENGTVAACLQSLSRYMVPAKDVKLARYEFFQCQQEASSAEHDGESMTSFINRARELVKSCNFGELEDEMLRDRIILGIRDVSLKKRFIEKQDLTSADVIKQCQTEEATQAEMERNRLFEAGPSTQAVNKLSSLKNRKCSYCGNKYHRKLSECPARGVTCNYCKQKNHYEAVCRKKLEDSDEDSEEDFPRKKPSKQKSKQVKTVSKQKASSGSGEESDFSSAQYLYSINLNNNESPPKASIHFWNTQKQLVQVPCIVDSGATCNVIGANNAKQILGVKRLKLDAERAGLTAFGGGSFKSLGRVTIGCVHNGDRYNMVFHVVDFDHIPLLSFRTCLKLNLIQLCFTVTNNSSVANPTAATQQTIDKCPEAFDGLDKLNGNVRHKMDHNKSLAVQQLRRIHSNMTTHIEKHDEITEPQSNCNGSTEVSSNQRAQPMQRHQVPSSPYRKLSMELCEVEQGARKTVYLITVDHDSDHFDLDELTAPSTAAVVEACKRNFAVFGKPHFVSTDCGVPFLNDEFRQFAQTWGFQHTVSTSYHQQTAVKTESAGKIVKRLAKKAYESNQDFWELLCQWRNTPNHQMNSSTQRLFLPKIDEDVKERNKKSNEEAKKWRVLSPLEESMPVYVKPRPTDKEWNSYCGENTFYREKFF